MVETFTGRAVVRCDHGTCAVRMDLGRADAWRMRGGKLPTGWLPVRGGHWCPQHQPMLDDFGLADVYGRTRAA